MRRSRLEITHLFFADDSILFGKATREGALAMKSVINEYEKILGQLENFEKSLIYFSNNTKKSTKSQIGNELGELLPII